ncbi:MAG: hypothetical protein H0T42_04110 [Deltaproteobacteria bacterium]|nr:hypothetical protein [Deltaproteobacteria bacterium]
MQGLKTSLVLLSILVAACGPSGRGGGDDTGDVDAPGSGATLTGKVYAPNQGPGQALAGQEIPVAGALVYVSTARPAPIPSGVYCEACVATPGGGVLTGADGSFTLETAPGHYWVVIEKGQFRIESEYDLTRGTLALTSQQTTLPSVWDPSTGRYMPKMAMAQGTSDNIEDILGKLGVGTLSGNSFSSPAGELGPELDILDYDGDVSMPGSVAYLLSNMTELRKYHIIFFPCKAGMPSEIDTMLQDQTILGNIRRYVSEGGKLYVTDWSGEIVDRAFPQQVTLGDSGADSDGTYDPVTFTGTLTTIGDADGGYYNSPDGKVVDPALSAWLGLQSGPTENGTSVGMYNPNMFEITDLWNWVKKLNPVQIGLDENSLPVYDTPKAWLTGSKPGEPTGTSRPAAITFEPAGCGKVLFTTFQTANSEHAGLYPQERVLLYLIMEITTCSDSPIL